MGKIPEILGEALKALENYFMSVDDYFEAIRSGVIVDKPFLIDDETFYLENPTHPLAKYNLDKRIEGADKIRDFRGKLPKAFIKKIHRYLFDCSGAVRKSLIMAIIKSAEEESLEIVRKMLETEERAIKKKRGSPMVKKLAGLTIIKLENPHYELLEFGLANYIGETKNGLANGHGVLYYSHTGDLIFDGEFKDNEFIKGIKHD